MRERLQAVLGHVAVRVLLLGVCFLALSLPVLTGRASDPGPALIAELFGTWAAVIGLLVLLARIDRGLEDERPETGATAAAADDDILTSDAAG